MRRVNGSVILLQMTTQRGLVGGCEKAVTRRSTGLINVAGSLRLINPLGGRVFTSGSFRASDNARLGRKGRWLQGGLSNDLHQKRTSWRCGSQQRLCMSSS